MNTSNSNLTTEEVHDMAKPVAVASLGAPTKVYEDGTPPKQGRSSVDYSEFIPTIEALRKEKPGTAWEWENVHKPAAIAQGLRKVFGIKASSRGVDKETKVGRLIIENTELDTDDEDDTSYSDNDAS